MLNFPVAMISTLGSRLFFFIALLLAVLSVHLRQAASAAAQQPEQPVQISSPAGGEALQGVVAIRGTSALSGFRMAEVAFAYQTNPTGTWFLIQQNSTPVQDGALASWDTTTIADGQYRLRLQVYLLDGRVLESEITGLRVRNYSSKETSTPAAGSEKTQAQAAQTLRPTLTLTLPDYQTTPRPLNPQPTNPAQVTPEHLRESALLGVGVVLGSFALAGIYLGLRLAARR